MREYLKNPEATAEAWRGGWFHTGDEVRRDAEGYFYFVDRRKDLIRRSGENISSSEVEAVIRSHPKVLDVAVIPVPEPGAPIDTFRPMRSASELIGPVRRTTRCT